MSQPPKKKRLALALAGGILALLFVAFAVWIIHEANIGRDNALFKLVRATPYGDKIGHFFLAGFLTVVANFFLSHRVWRLGRVPLPVGSLLIVSLAALEEASQFYLPTRSLDFMDFVANLVGILAFSLPVFFVQRKRRSAAGWAGSAKGRRDFRE